MDWGDPLDDVMIAQLRAGDTVMVRRQILAAPDRPAHTRCWTVRVEQLIHEAEGLWVLVPAEADPPHAMDFLVGAVLGMNTELHALAAGASGRRPCFYSS